MYINSPHDSHILHDNSQHEITYIQQIYTVGLFTLHTYTEMYIGH